MLESVLSCIHLSNGIVQGRVPFAVPESVPWPKLGEQLNIKFQQLTGRGLSQDSLDYLASKIFGGYKQPGAARCFGCLLYTSDAADDC